MARNVLVAIGTRPEAIKLFPVIRELKRIGGLRVVVTAIGQHPDMLGQTMDALRMSADLWLDVMLPGQPIAWTMSRVIEAVHGEMKLHRPDLLGVQGDTTTALACALAAFYEGIPVAHVEAGLRTRNLGLPFPEEANRQMLARIAVLHFAPTETAKQNLLDEGVGEDRIHVLGNTVVDTLHHALLHLVPGVDLEGRFPWLKANRKLVLVTGHRREALPHGLAAVCKGLLNILEMAHEVEVAYATHLNPQVRQVLDGLIVPGSLANRFHLLEPLDYPVFLGLLQRAWVAITDSGGVQEEAPYLGVPVLCTRDVTERPEGVAAGVVRMVGQDPAALTHAIHELLRNEAAYKQMARKIEPYGDGHAGRRIARVMASFLGVESHNDSRPRSTL